MTDYNLPPGPFGIVYADPPWNYRDTGIRGGTKKHYSTMTLETLCGEFAHSVRQIVADDALLFMWGTYPLLPEMFLVARAWGFEYKTLAFQWVKRYANGKPFIGCGHWTRSNTEGCFLFTRGKPPRRVDSGVSQVIESVPERHSAKPREARDRIDRLMGFGPGLRRIELFARSVTSGWTSWGNEV